MKWILLVAMMTLPIAMTGCGTSTIDGSTSDKMISSLAVMKEGLTDVKVKELEEALVLIFFDKVDVEAVMSGASTESPESIDKRLRGMLDGKTAKQIVSMAKDIKESH